MKFQQYFLLKESPDSSLVTFQPKVFPDLASVDFQEKSIKGDFSLRIEENGSVWFFVNYDTKIFLPITFYMFKNFVLYASTNRLYHGDIREEIKSSLYLTHDLPHFIYNLSKNVKIFGEITEKDYQNLKEWNHSGSSLEYFFNDNLLEPLYSGRTWRFTEETSLVSLWQQRGVSRIILNEALVKRIIIFMNEIYPGINPDKILYDAFFRIDSGEFTPLLKGSVQTIKNIVKPEEEDPIIHQLPPEKKKAALLKMGARPKIPKGINFRREGD